mmetsp:Transcript_1850/g.1294  ORF Transcript_1850/g.1294 Transcript_1850/m.1294 type:complete len:103 (+) Transcript_1850:114-422(+)
MVLTPCYIKAAVHTHPCSKIPVVILFKLRLFRQASLSSLLPCKFVFEESKLFLDFSHLAPGDFELLVGLLKLGLLAFEFLLEDVDFLAEDILVRTELVVHQS